MSASRVPIELDSELYEAAAAVASSTGQRPEQLVESAVRVYLKGLSNVLTRVRPTRGLDDEVALKLAYEELDAARRERE